jgi:hypothetical protein
VREDFSQRNILLKDWLHIKPQRKFEDSTALLATNLWPVSMTYAVKIVSGVVEPSEELNVRNLFVSLKKTKSNVQGQREN